MDEHDLANLRARMGDHHLGSRLRAQVNRILHVTGQGRGGLHYENVEFLMRVANLGLRASGLGKLGHRNALDFQVRENRARMRDLPQSFDGLRILHLSDLHLDGFAGMGARIAQSLVGIDFDLAVLTGDYRFHTTGQYGDVARELGDLIPGLQMRAQRFGVYGILGNHDFVEMVPVLESAGVKTLLNESVALKDGAHALSLVGLDDAHFYGLHDFDKALRAMPNDTARILLVHSPEIISEASRYGFGLYLTGHTHGGQICLPNGLPLLVNAKCSRRYVAGAWSYNGMSGYTSRGVGSSGVFARFFCPPELVVHILQRA
jgi:predicted MPP superfamily phosphohydrolase